VEAALKQGPQHVDRRQPRIAPPLWYHFNHQFRVGGERLDRRQHAGEHAVVGALHIDLDQARGRQFLVR
jgi:hypothetical protein